MPITLEKLFSPTATVSFPFLGETVNVTFAPWKYTGEMQDLLDRLQAEQATEREEMAVLIEQANARDAEADRLNGSHAADVATLRARAAELRDEASQHEVRLDHRDKAALRDVLSKLLVTWDVLDAKGKPIPTTGESLNGLPDVFLWAVFLSLNQENQPDPTPAPPSNEPSSSRTTARSRTGSRTSLKPEPSVSRRSSSTNGRNGRSTTRSGVAGR